MCGIIVNEPGLQTNEFDPHLCPHTSDVVQLLKLSLVQGVSKSMQPINMIMIYCRDKPNGGDLEYVL